MAKREINIFSISILDLLSGALGAVIILYIIIPKLNTEDVELLDDVRALQEQAQTVEEILAELENSIPEEVFAEIEEKLNSLKQEVDELQEMITSLSAKIEDLQQRLATCEEERDRLTERIENLEAEVRELQSQISACEEESQELEAQNRRLAEENQRLTDDLESSTERLMDCESELRESNFMLVLIKWETPNHDVDLWVSDPNGRDFNYEDPTFPGIRGQLTVDDTLGPGLEVFQIKDAYEGEYKIRYRFYSANGNTSQNPVVTGQVFYNKGAVIIPRKTLYTAGRNSRFTDAMTVTVGSGGTFSFD